MGGKLLLGGYLGCGNLGDDAVMLGLVNGFGNDPYEVTVLSGNPEHTQRTYGFPSVPRRDMAAVEAAIDACDALVFPGGSIFQDTTSVRSVYYYSSLVKSAKKKGKKVLLLAQGVGPLNHFMGRMLAKSAFEMADAVSVRDPESVTTLKELGVAKTATLTADSALLLPMPPDTNDSAFNVGSMKTIGLAPRPLKKGKADVVGLFAEFCKILFQSGSMPVLIEMDTAEDMELIQEISKRVGGKVPDLRKVGTVMNMQQRLARMESVIAMRLHAGILATSVGVPPLMVSYDPKVAAFAKALDLGPALNVEGLTPTRLMDVFVAFQKNRDTNVKVIEKKSQMLRDLAGRNIDILRSTIR